MEGGKPKSAADVGKTGPLEGGRDSGFDVCLDKQPELPREADVVYGAADTRASQIMEGQQ